MTILLSHSSALETLRRYDLRKRLATGERWTLAVPSKSPDEDERQRLCFPSVSEPIEVLVTDSGQRIRTESLVTRASGTPLPPNSVIEVSKGVYCIAPEHLAVQMACELEFIELIYLLGELFGSYALAPQFESGTFERPVPLTTPERVMEHLAKLGGARGAKRLRRALQYACTGSASPRETMLSMRLGLPPSLGGYGLEVLSMNEPLEVKRFVKGLGSGVRKPDILLKARKKAKTGFNGVAVDYDGREHLSDTGHMRDLRRQNELLAINFKNYAVDKWLYHDLDYMDGLVEQIRKDLGMPRQHLTKREWMRRRAARQDLHDELERICAPKRLPEPEHKAPRSVVSSFDPFED